VWRELTEALPGCATWQGMAGVVAALRGYERECAPLLERAGLARDSPFRIERLSAGAPVMPMLAWLALLAGQSNEPTEA